MTTASSKAAAPRRKGLIVWLVLLAIALVGFILLGNWQIRRLHWKLQLIHDVTTRVHAPPVAAPGPAKWSSSADTQYLHVRLRGHYIQGKQTLVHGGSAKGYGYWVMTPFETQRDFIVLVDRGYIPASLPGTPAYAKAAPPAGQVTLTGLLRYSEPGGSFMRSNKPKANQWYSRDVAAIAKAQRLPSGQVAAYFVDADAGLTDQHYPIGGLTKIHFRNAHLGYAITWYLLALGCLLAGGIVIYQRRRHAGGSAD